MLTSDHVRKLSRAYQQYSRGLVTLDMGTFDRLFDEHTLSVKRLVLYCCLTRVLRPCYDFQMLSPSGAPIIPAFSVTPCKL